MAEASMVPIKSDNGKPHRAEPFAFLEDFEAEMERFWHRPVVESRTLAASDATIVARVHTSGDQVGATDGRV
jgi:hypothetical protein